MTEATKSSKFQLGPVEAELYTHSVVIQADHADTGDPAEIIIDFAEARALCEWVLRVIPGVHMVQVIYGM